MNLAQRIGQLALAAGEYGPGGGPPAMLPNPTSGLLELTRPPPHKRYRQKGETGIAKRVLEALPEIDAGDRLAIEAGAVYARDVANMLPDVGYDTVLAYLSQLQGVARIGRPKQYRYHRRRVREPNAESA
jgi:hypothetical protein